MHAASPTEPSRWRLIPRLINERSLPVQFGLAALAAAGAAALVALLLDGARDTVIAVLGGGAAASLAAVALARRVCGALERMADGARALARENAPPESNIPLDASSPELRRVTSRARHLVDVFRERLQTLIAQNAALGRRLEHRTHELATLQDLSIGLATKDGLHELVEEALGALEQTLEYSSASVWARQDLEPAAMVTLLGYRAAEGATGTLDITDLRGMRLSSANLQKYEEIEREREAIVDNRARQSLLSWLWSKIVDDAQTSALYRTTRSWAALPMKFRDAVLGVLRVDHHEDDYFDAERLRLLTAVASQAALAMRHARLQAQEREMAVIAERNRIARDLHDAVSQTLFAANLMAGTMAKLLRQDTPIDAAALATKAAALERLNRGALAEMRLLMFELRPDAIEQTKIPELLHQVTEAIACRGEIAVRERLARDDALAAPVRVHLYRIAQEALSNVVRHSGARSVDVEWRFDAGAGSALRIADDGKGFDPDEARPGHFGLGNMRARAAEIGASFTLTSRPGAGTELLVQLA